MDRSFFSYFPVAPKDRAWGLYATSFGQVHVSPGIIYPPGQHPQDHHFAWEQGRTLNHYQLLYIHEGSGFFESTLTRKKKLSAGSAFFLFPGIWHRYRPDFATGWTETWIEMNGPHIDRLVADNLLDPAKPVFRIEATSEVEFLIQSAASLARTKPPGFAVRLGLIAVEIATLVRSRTVVRHIAQIVSKAQVLLGQDLDKAIMPQKIAREMGVSYSYFRREFKRQTGFSPKQYRIQIRLRRAKDLLRNTNHTIKEISEQLGYYSPYHLTLDFSKSVGAPPSRWRAEGRAVSSQKK
jgi:AraC-like DNA-binding protein